MAKKFSDFANSNLNNFVKDNEHVLNNILTNNAKAIDEINFLLSKFKNMSSNEIFNEFLRVAEQKKREGTLTLQYINNLKTILFPYLTDEQKRIFNNLMNYIR